MRTDILTTYRFFAATLVVTFHFAKNTAFGAHFPVLVESGPEMVTFFFVLSGFIMGVTCLDNPAFARRDYWLRRFSRIYPAYLLAAAMMLFLFPRLAGAGNTAAIALHLTLLQSWVPRTALSVNGPGWSLSVEAFFYALLPLLVAGTRHYRLTARQSLVIAVLCWLLTQAIHTMCLHAVVNDPKAPLRNWVLYFPPSHLCSFLLGLAGYQWAKTRNSWHGSIPLLCLVALMGLIITVLAHEAQFNTFLGTELPFEASLLSPLFLLLILATINSENVLTLLLATRPMQRLGDASYGIYIFQKPLWLVYRATIFPFINTTLHWHLANDIHFFFYLLLLVAFALAVMQTVENPAKRLLRQLFQASR